MLSQLNYLNFRNRSTYDFDYLTVTYNRQMKQSPWNNFKVHNKQTIEQRPYNPIQSALITNNKTYTEFNSKPICRSGTADFQPSPERDGCNSALKVHPIHLVRWPAMNASFVCLSVWSQVELWTGRGWGIMLVYCN